jgi:hypothetical protein
LRPVRRGFVARSVTFVFIVAPEGGLAGFFYLSTRPEHILAASFTQISRR